MKRSPGFTLLEVLITISILAVISVMAARTIQQSVKAKAKIQDQVDDLSRVRDALRLMERDIGLAFHYRDVEKEIEQALKKQQNPQSTPPPPGSQPGGFYGNPAFNANNQDPPREAPRQDPTTHFICSDEELHFVTMNNSRIQANVRQADFVEVGYSLKDCQTSESGSCLWRRSSPLVDSDVKTGGDELVLLDHVAELKFRCIGRGKTDWVSQWDTGPGGDAVTKGNFPWAVEISLTFQKGEGDAVKRYAMQIVAPVHFPNNPEEDTRGTTQPNSAQPGK